MSSSNNDFSDGDAYEKLMGRWSKRVGDQFLDWLKPAPKLDWLDVGCGNGAFTEDVIARCKPSSVTGIDPSEGQIAYARHRAGTAMAKFEVGDAQTLPFGDARFDVVTMALVIAFISDPARALAEQRRVVKPGGTIAAYMWDMPQGGFPGIHIFDAFKALGLPNPRPVSSSITTQDAMGKIWRDTGLENVETTTFHITVSFDSFEDYWQTFNLPAGPQSKIMRDLTPELRADTRNILLKTLPIAADGKISFQSFANAVKGRKAA